jgi:LysM repeat protein
MRVRLSGFVLTALALAAPCLQASDRPPQDLHQVGDHWTAWNPPQPPPNVKTHVIVKGDTLWELAKTYYGNPYLWPQIWEKNQYILDAHWIYPGDVLVLGPEVAPVDHLATNETPGDETAGAAPAGGEEAAPTAPVPGVLTPAAAAGSPVPLGSEGDIYCSGFIAPDDQEFPFSIIGTEYERLGPNLDVGIKSEIQTSYGRVGTIKVDLSTGDIIYVDGGKARGLSPGSVFTVVSREQPVLNPYTKKRIGRFYHYVGRVRVLSVQESTAIAEIIQSCDPVHVGALLQPFEPEPVPLGRPSAMRPANYPTTAEKLRDSPMIVLSQDEVITLGEDHVVYIDRGADKDVTPGDIFTIYRPNREGMPPIVIGELAILSVHKTSSVGKIIQSRYPVYVGDLLDPK